jgi:hypothetical protein
MRTYTKYIALAVLLSMVTLGFASKNNIGMNFANLGWGEDPKEISEEEVQKRVDEKVVEPITASLVARDPYMLMTKCYSRIDASLSNAEETSDFLKFYEGQLITGTVKFIRCGRASIICSYRLSLITNEVNIRETFLEPWISLVDYQKKIESQASTEE